MIENAMMILVSVLFVIDLVFAVILRIIWVKLKRDSKESSKDF